MRLSAPFSMRLALWLAVFCSLVSPVRAQEDVLPRGTDAAGLCGLYQLGAPTCSQGATLSSSFGYGVTRLDGRHDRVFGDIAIGYVPRPWLALSLELAGRVDIHPDDELGSDVTGTGDPRLRLRAGAPVGRGVKLGGEVGVWIPGTHAPSFQLSATSVDLRGLLGWTHRHFQTLGMLGVRIDHSANAAPPLDRLRQGDRIALGLSDFHALLLGLGLSYTIIPKVSVYGELSAQWLLGRGAPTWLESPMRLALGARYFVKPSLQLELALATSLSQRPGVAPDDPLVPIEPRISAVIGVRFTFGTPKPAALAEPGASPQFREPLPEPPRLATLSGALADPTGAPLPDASVRLVYSGGTLETVTDAEGRFDFAELPPEKAELRADAAGFKSEHWEVEIQRPGTQLPTRTLQPGESTGLLRCLVRSFSSDALRGAQVSVRNAAGNRVGGGSTDANGALELALPPGQYRVMIEAGGYRSQRTNVQVAANEVAILNVDMRKVE